MGDMTSRSPGNTAGASIYTISKLMGTCLSFKQIAQVLCSPEDSLRDTYKEIVEKKEMYMATDWLKENKLDVEKVTYP